MVTITEGNMQTGLPVSEGVMQNNPGLNRQVFATFKLIQNSTLYPMDIAIGNVELFIVILGLFFMLLTCSK